METAVLSKRIWLYLINTILYEGLGLLSALPFLLVLRLHVVWFILISVGFATIISFLLGLFFLSVTNGYTFGSALLRVKYVSYDGKKIRLRQILIRSAAESIAIFALFDLLYFIRNHTERGVIDRLSNSFAIDIAR